MDSHPVSRRTVLRALAGAAALATLPRAPAQAAKPTPAATGPANSAGADERTPSRSEYFSWINNTNEGATAAQTRINLEFFHWLREEYGLQLDLYAFDAGAIDGANFYGSMNSARFRRQFPGGFGPLAEQAAADGTRLGLWGGPDGFGDTAAEEEARIAEMTSLCRDFGFALFKMDAVCGQLRPEKYGAFDRMMTACRRYVPDLILLNHRLDLGPGMRHATTFLLGGAETYIDVFMANRAPAPHHRAGAMDRELPPRLTRMTEDHGVCLSSCLDGWQDELVLQAFNRSLIVAPQIYGNPWLLRDDEFAQLAAIFNLHRKYRDILVQGIVLPEKNYGPCAVARGDGVTRLITLRNLTWEPVECPLALDESIGLERTDRPVTVTQLHPWRESLGRFTHGAATRLTVLPFRACLVRVASAPAADWEIEGCAYEVVRDVPGRPVEVNLLALPGSKVSLTLADGSPPFRSATLDGGEVPLASGVEIAFPGNPPREPWHRRLGTLQPAPVPADAESLYEATCFAADNNALEVRSLQRSGPTATPVVQRARDAFFGQHEFRVRDLWDRNLFDDDPDTAFAVNLRWVDARIKGGAFRLDLGAIHQVDELVLETFDDFSLQPLKAEEGVYAQVSADLREWRTITFLAGLIMRLDLRRAGEWRYLRFAPGPLRLRSVRGFVAGRALDRANWRASNLFAPYLERHWQPARVHRAHRVWTVTTTIAEAAPGAYLCVAVHGQHGREGAIAAFRAGGRLMGCPDRSPSFPSNTWETPVRPAEQNYTYYLPVTPEMVGSELEAVVLGMNPDYLDFAPELWLTNHAPPFVTRKLMLER